MSPRTFPLLAGLLLQLVPVATARDLTVPTTAERRELSRDLRRFYDSSSSDASPLRSSTNKYDARTGERVFPNASLGDFKSTDEFRLARCRAFNKSLFSDGPCNVIHGLDATAEKHDRVEQLTESWIQPENLAKEMDSLPIRGKTRLKLWSTNNWLTKNGGLSHRYAERVKFTTYEKAISHYFQPDAWTSLVEGYSFSQLPAAIRPWSPAEKYDLTVNDERFSLTVAEKVRGKQFLVNGDVPSWIGVCHGWAAATIMMPAAMRPVSAIGANGVAVPWMPSDVRALASLHWSSGKQDLNFVGGRCETKKDETHPNGRLKQEECFDSNPATFHLALANMVGRFGHSFVMDKTFDHQVWNQPIHSYRFQYYNPHNTGSQSDEWSDVAVEYDASFKTRDRFQKPLTRGSLINGRQDDSRIRKVVGVIATVVYAAAHRPNPGSSPGTDALVRETFLYDLELESQNDQWIPVGGEWLKNSHPDFLWIPKRGSVTSHAEDVGAGRYLAKATPAPSLTAAAQRASRENYPLCTVVQELTRLSSEKGNEGKAAIRCAGDPDTSSWLVEVTEELPTELPGENCTKPDAPATVIVSSDWPTAQYWMQGKAMGDFSRSRSHRLATPRLKGCMRYSYDMVFYSPRLGSHGYTYQSQNLKVPFEAGETIKVHLNHHGELTVLRD